MVALLAKGKVIFLSFNEQTGAFSQLFRFEPKLLPESGKHSICERKI